MTTPPIRQAAPEVWQFELHVDYPNVWAWRLEHRDPFVIYPRERVRNVRKLGDTEQARAQSFREGVEAAIECLAECADILGDDDDIYVNREEATRAICARTPATADAPDELAALRAENEKLRRAAEDVIASRMDTFKARNGRRLGLEDDSGEKCWIIPFDNMIDLEQALNRDPPAALAQKEG